MRAVAGLLYLVVVQIDTPTSGALVSLLYLVRMRPALQDPAEAEEVAETDSSMPTTTTEASTTTELQISLLDSNTIRISQPEDY